MSGGEIRVGGARYGSTREEIRERKVRLLPEAPLRNACVCEHVRRAQRRHSASTTVRRSRSRALGCG